MAIGSGGAGEREQRHQRERLRADCLGQKGSVATCFASYYFNNASGPKIKLRSKICGPNYLRIWRIPFHGGPSGTPGAGIGKFANDSDRK